MTLQHTHYVDLHDIYRASHNAKYMISHREFKHSIHTLLNPEYRGQKEGDIITILSDKEKQEVVMSDSWMERYTNQAFIQKAKGDVLIAGLGLGMIILAIQGKAEVNSITVIEKDRQLGDLVLNQLGKYLSSTVEVIYEDIFQYKTEKKFNIIYFDIWNSAGENYDQMVTLKKRFKKNRVKPVKQSPIICWREKEAKQCSEPKRSGQGENLWW